MNTWCLLRLDPEPEPPLVQFSLTYVKHSKRAAFALFRSAT